MYVKPYLIFGDRIYLDGHKTAKAVAKNYIQEMIQRYFGMSLQYLYRVMGAIALFGKISIHDICRNIFKRYKGVRVLIFTGEILNEKLWVDVLNAGADGIILKTGELLTKTDVQAVMDGKKLVFNYPILEKIVDRFKKSVANDAKRQEAVINYDIDEYDERFLRHLALGYTKDMIANLKGMPFGVKSLEKRQNDLIGRLFPNGERVGVNATRLAVRALELRIIDLDNLEADEE